MADENKQTAVFPNLVEDSGKPSLLQFGPFTLDLQRHGLYLDGKRVHLTSKPFETLAVLVEHRGKTVEKQKLMDAVWKDAFVTEDSLVKAVREIRRVLGDEKGSPQFIQTVPGEGYRFIAEVTPANPQRQVFTGSAAPTSTVQEIVEVKEPNATHDTVTLTVPVRKRLPLVRFRTVAAVLGVLAILAAGILLLPWRSGSSTQRSILTLSGLHPGASFSPDGNWIAVVIDDANGVAQVWVQNLNGGQPIPITSGDLHASHPRWSPKNDAIVFSRGEPTESVWSVPPFGGGLDPKLLIEGGSNANWSSDGNQLVFEKDSAIWTANADGTNQQRVDGVPPIEPPIWAREPSFSPDGSQIAFFQNGDGPMGDIWVIPSKGGIAERLTSDNHFGGGPVWTPDGYIFFSSQRGGSKTLWKIRPGGVPEPVLNSPGEDTHPEISPDGSRLIYTRTRNWWVLTLKDVLSGKTHELRESLTDMYFPTFSPRGDKIAFFATVDGGDIQIFTIRTDGTDLTQVTRAKGERNVFPRWSADGSKFYFYQLRPTVSFRQISAAGGESSEIVNGWKWRTHNSARVDADGTRVIFTRRENRKATTIVRDIETTRERVFERTLGEPQWSKDGKSVVGFEITVATYRSGTSGDILVCSVDAGTCRKVASNGTGPIWSGDESRIYFARLTSRNSLEILSVSANGEDEQRVDELNFMDPDANFFDVSSTGQVVYVQFKPGKPELWMMDFK